MSEGKVKIAGVSPTKLFEMRAPLQNPYVVPFPVSFNRKAQSGYSPADNNGRYASPRVSLHFQVQRLSDRTFAMG